jgi:hypothetical protein
MLQLGCKQAVLFTPLISDDLYGDGTESPVVSTGVGGEQSPEEVTARHRACSLH